MHHGGTWHRGELTILSLIEGYYGAAACLVSFGLILGRSTPAQLVFVASLGACPDSWLNCAPPVRDSLIMMTIYVTEVGFYSLNKYVTLYVLEAVDLGGSQTVHLFGASFGRLTPAGMMTATSMTESFPILCVDAQASA